MRKVLLIIFFLGFTAQYLVGQTIKVEQYTVLIKRTITRSNSDIYTWQYQSCNGAEYCTGDHPPACCSYDENGACCQNNSMYYSYSHGYRVDPYGGCSNNDYFIPRVYRNGSPISENHISLSGMAKGETREYSETIPLYQAFDVTSVETEIGEYNVYNPYYYETSSNFDVDCHNFISTSSLVPKGELYEDSTFSSSYDNRYYIKTHVRVVPSQDVTYTMPSHDKIRMGVANTGFNWFTTTWEYFVPGGTPQQIPSSFYLTSRTLEISAYDLLGEGYKDLLNQNIFIQAKNQSGSKITPAIPFTVRLSSPHITSVTPYDLNCFERNEGSMNIRFDRALLEGEKLNILLIDTVNRVNYSAFNLAAFAGDNSYTWPNELRAGTYQISLIGKYAKGIPYDLYVNDRAQTPPPYMALNSVNFEDGYNTPETDDFNVNTDYAGYAQATYTGAVNHIAFQKLTQPAKIRFVARVDKQVSCKGSATGEITLAAAGGKFNYKYSLKREGETDYSSWINFANNDIRWIYIQNPFFTDYSGVLTQVKNLKAGKYTVRIRDEVDCYAKDSAGNEVTFPFTIKEPEKGITLDLFEVSPITAHDAANAQVKVQISGGTPFVTTPEVAHDPYIVTFTNKAAPDQQLPLTNTILEANKRMQSVTGLLPEGDYVLRIYDAYYANITTDSGCFLEMKIPIRKPEELLVSIKNKKPVSCYDSTDGKLVADATGGIKIDSLKYTFKWYKVTNEGNTLLTDTDSLLENVAAGSYQVEVTDKYNNKKTSQTFEFTQPSPILLNPTSIPTNCYTDSNGVLQVAVTGGTPYGDGSYRYEWSTGARTPVVNKVLGGDYVIVVTDSMFCMARGTVSVTSPVRILPNAVVTTITCRGNCDGQIALNATGGQGVYTYTWSTGATTATINNLCPGTYWYKVQDIGGCSESDTIIIVNPDTLAVNLGADRKICIGQTIRLNATASDTAVLTYNWQNDNGFTANSARVAITEAGMYRVAVSNRGGCVVRDTVVITAQNSNINTDYVVSTQAFINENITLVNISQPRTDSVKWMLPSNGNVIRPVLETNDKCELIIADTGLYAITMQAYYASGCIDDTTKTVNVINRSGSVTTGNQSNAYLQSFGIFPNPNNGVFTVNLKFSEVTRARLRLINSLTNVTVDSRLIQGFAEYQEEYNTGQLMSGVYILVIDASKGSFVYKVIIAH